MVTNYNAGQGSDIGRLPVRKTTTAILDAGSKQQETVKNKLKNIVQDSRLFRFLLRGKSPSNFLAAT